MNRRLGQDSGTLERSAQHLPIPLGRQTPAHARPRRGTLHRRLAAHWTSFVIAIGLITAALGVAVSLAAPELEVFADHVGVHVGASLLRPRAAPPGALGRFFAGDATLVIVTLASGTVRSAAVTTVSGLHATGSCAMKMTEASASEQCEFNLGVHSFGARDTYRSADGVWTRTYTDGGTVRIVVPRDGLLVPIPFPIGRE